MYALEGISARQTRDLDLLGMKIANTPSNIESCMAEVIALDFEEDGVRFDSQTLTTSEIVKEGNYRGVRIEFIGQLGQIREKLQIDVGFGDVVIPSPALLHYPTLLDLPGPEILAYSVESVIAEKFHAMVYLGELNSRMKDFHDLYRLLRPGRYDGEVLRRALYQTFKARDTELKTDPVVFDPAFSADKNRIRLWQSFLAKSRLAETPFEEVAAHIRSVLTPLISEK